jgi:putative ABC transport system ATP-binding protein
MNILGCLDSPTTGKYILNNKDVSRMPDNDLAEVRNKEIGFVFQQFNLLARTSALENVALPLVYAGVGEEERRKRSLEMLEKVGLADRLNNTPAQLSGGQQQRVNFARSLVNDPHILVLDEPTGNLDQRSAGEMICLLWKEITARKLATILVTHNEALAKRTDATYYLAQEAALQ